MSILIENISKSFGDVKALQQISFKVDTGGLFGLIGPDGAGKTTLFRILVTVLQADEGNAFVAGINVNDFKAVRKIVGYMPGRFSLYQDLSVEENLEFFATVFGTTIKANYELVRDSYVQLEPFKNRKAGQLSGGMKQKLALCCALIHRPKVLFLDEPTTGVDAVSRKEFWEMLKRIQKENITIMVSTPYMDEASLCDHVALIQNGKIMQSGTPMEIKSGYPKKLYALRTQNIYALQKTLEGFDELHSIHLFGDALHISTEQNFNQTKLISYAHSNGFADIELTPIEAGIEDCFLELMS